MGICRIMPAEGEDFGGSADLQTVTPLIRDSYWTDEQGNRITRMPLGNRVRFVMETQHVPSGTTFNLELSAFYLHGLVQPTRYRRTKFGGRPLTLQITIRNHQGSVELDLPEAWCNDLKEFYKERRSLKLCWRLRFAGRYKNVPEENHRLTVRYPDNRLYIRPSEADPYFPEMYTPQGELLVPLKTLATVGISESASGVAEKISHELVLARLEQGYLVASNGKIYQRKSARSQSYPRYSGETVHVQQGINIGFRTRQGSELIKVTTKGINQYEYFVQATENSVGIKLIGGLNQLGNVLDFVNILKFAADGTSDKMLPIPGYAGVLNLAVKNFLDDFHTGYLEILDEILRRKLEEAKAGGQAGVKAFANSKYGWGNGYRYEDITVEVAMGIYRGDFKTVNQALDAVGLIKAESAAILYRECFHPVTEESICVIEAFYINLEYV